jgi:hypothetical protein
MPLGERIDGEAVRLTDSMCARACSPIDMHAAGPQWRVTTGAHALCGYFF